ncbi:MAG: glycosyltransferase family 2 protein [Fimbriiglobus sp.]
MIVTVIVPVRNEATAIEPTLRALLTQAFPASDFEVIVADGGSVDATVPIVRRLQGEFENLKLVFNPAGFSSAGRNVAVRHMAGEYAVIVDGHCVVPTRTYLRELVAAFETSGADSLGRPQPLDAPGATPFQLAVAAARASRLGHNPGSDIYSDQPKFVEPQSTAVAYRRSVFEKIGLFDERFDACEDVEFNHRVYAAGLTCYFAPALTVNYHPRATWAALFRQLARYGCGRARLAAKHRDSLTLPAVVPPLWLVWVALAPAVAVAVPALGWAVAASLILYGTVVLAVAAKLGRGQPAAVAVRIPAVFVGIHAGFGWGFLRETVRKSPA